MQVFHAEQFSIELPAGHRFPMSKYRRLYEALRDTGPACLRFCPAPPVARVALERIHSAEYVARIFDGKLTPAQTRVLGFPWSQALLQRSRRSVGATLAALGAARKEGIAASLAGGTHHAAHDHGAGFCVFNDVVAAATAALDKPDSTRLLVVDCDVHQGDGTATMLAAQPRAYTFSIHSARNYPHHKAVSDLDIALPDGCDDARYLRELELGLSHAFHVARPQVVLFIAGADVYAGDRLGRLALSPAGIATRDSLVFERAEAQGAAVVVVMGGGYAEPIEHTVRIQQRSVELAAASWRRRQGGVQGNRAPA